ncbi:thiamine phosphate synthase [Spirosoma endbachense]|uniref:Thiamine phosphate synthase n=1 Tax=Spirosoma endbachense TaxID=2666025 RepID=A0A6P1VPM3_9BACT|nr:thiamine phosphate synthase [Spirosoma endbachense]QHV93920.1 thiamine phosphate synthase [Spirosoma endbachense]
MSSKPFLLIGITDDSPQSQHIPTLTGLFDKGLDFLYWRTFPFAEAMNSLFPAVWQSAVLLAGDNAPAVPAPFRWHLKESNRQFFQSDEYSTQAQRQQPFSTSIHNLQEWPLLAGQVELVFYSPIFPSISKPGYGPSASLDTVAQQLKTIREESDNLPLLIGLGGIDENNVALVKQAGFDGAALMGALWQRTDPIAGFECIQTALLF